jgi:hypothetical protein
MTASMIKSAMRRHVELEGIEVVTVNSRYVEVAGVKVNAIAVYQVLNGAGEDTLNPETFACELSGCAY